MKLSLNSDFTKFPRAVSVAPADSTAADIAGTAVLAHDERTMRRRAIELVGGGKMLVDLLEQVTLQDGDRLVLDDGRHVEIVAAPEELYAVRGRDAVHLAELAWHVGSRHLAASMSVDRILVLRDHAVRGLLEQLGASISEVAEAFAPVASVALAPDPHHHHHPGHGHHAHGEMDAYGRLPGDPHYGHNHA